MFSHSASLVSAAFAAIFDPGLDAFVCAVDVEENVLANATGDPEGARVGVGCMTVYTVVDGVLSGDTVRAKSASGKRRSLPSYQESLDLDWTLPIVASTCSTPVLLYCVPLSRRRLTNLRGRQYPGLTSQSHDQRFFTCC